MHLVDGAGKSASNRTEKNLTRKKKHSTYYYPTDAFPARVFDFLCKYFRAKETTIKKEDNVLRHPWTTKNNTDACVQTTKVVIVLLLSR